jgi:hypothetical protein
VAVADVADLPPVEGDVNTSLPCPALRVRFSRDQPSTAAQCPARAAGRTTPTGAPGSRQATAKCPQMARSGCSCVGARHQQRSHATSTRPGMRLLGSLGGLVLFNNAGLNAPPLTDRDALVFRPRADVTTVPTA